jgi:hypothetical protein
MSSLRRVFKGAAAPDLLAVVDDLGITDPNLAARIRRYGLLENR